MSNNSVRKHRFALLLCAPLLFLPAFTLAQGNVDAETASAPPLPSKSACRP